MGDFDFTDRDGRQDHDDDDSHDRAPAPLDGTSRPYVHDGCGTCTVVSGSDYSHICNPFWPCSGTYCCGCQGFVPLNSVVWEDTGEPVSEFRRRMMSLTPIYVKLWAFGPGFLPGALVGGLGGFGLAHMLQKKIEWWTIVGASIGGLAVYLIGLAILFMIAGVNYTRTR
jgi:hypothetical protein